MANVKVLLEIKQRSSDPFERHAAALESEAEAVDQATSALSALAGLGVEVDEDIAPVPMFSLPGQAPAAALETFALGVAAERQAPKRAPTMVVPADVSRSRLDELRAKDNVTVWPNSQMTYFGPGDTVFDRAPSRGGLDCRPFRDGAEVEEVRAILGIDALWEAGFLGQNVVVGILDEGVNGDEYPVIGGFSRPSSPLQPGAAAIDSHGSMCAADVLVAAPSARLYDYPFLGVPSSGGALQMFQAVLNQRRIDGTPHITNNSYGFTGVPPAGSFPNHEIHDINHPLHRKIREVVAAGIACFFAAGNCGENCPSGNCHFSGIGPGQSIHGSNSLVEVITVAAVNSRRERIGYSSQGPGMFEERKPDIAAYSHIFANFGPGRPGGTAQPFDNGTSAATPVAAGVAAALLSAAPDTSPVDLKTALIESAIDLGSTVGWDANHGHGVINPTGALRQLAVPPLLG